MLCDRDILVHHIFDKLNIVDISRLRQVDIFFGGIISRQIIMDKIIRGINDVWIYSFGDSIQEFKKLLVNYNGIVLWNIYDCEIDIEILVSCQKDEKMYELNHFDIFMIKNKYSPFQMTRGGQECGEMYGYHERSVPIPSTIYIMWFANSSLMDAHIFMHKLLSTRNSYTICKETGKEKIIISDWL